LTLVHYLGLLDSLVHSAPRALLGGELDCSGQSGREILFLGVAEACLASLLFRVDRCSGGLSGMVHGGYACAFSLWKGECGCGGGRPGVQGGFGC
jgi:hypothetical protein